ncbi:ABC transporter ATP-binding protein [Paenibacillus sp. 1P07SE]|uniref:ABC transporter ATP-binding protein n=1 Tax=Paenibacillus sp. 1P07SE TaxID=3132209 RepID=UPI0039A452D9
MNGLSEAAIELSALTKAYGSHLAVNRLDLTIPRGEIFGLLGPNGAGKTTTILMLLGLSEPTAGRVRVLGLDPAADAIEIKRKVGYMPDDIGFYEDRTGLDNLIYTARLNGIPVKEATDSAYQLLERVGLGDAADKKTGTYSRGMRQRLGLADVLIKRPEMIILDEPTLGIDPRGVTELLRLITALSREEGLTVLLSSHHLHQVQQVCDRVGLFVNGELVACGDLADLASQLDQQGNDTLVDLEIQGWNEGLEHKLQELEGVSSVKMGDICRTGTVNVHVTCSDETIPVIARLAATHAELQSIRRHSYQLDDIYRRYFEGSDGHGA